MKKGHIEGAVNIPFGKGMQENFKNLPAGRLLVACYSGQTAAQVTAILRTLGYDADALTFGMSSTLNGWYKKLSNRRLIKKIKFVKSKYKKRYFSI